MPFDPRGDSWLGSLGTWEKWGKTHRKNGEKWGNSWEKWGKMVISIGFCSHGSYDFYEPISWEFHGKDGE
jgi:hypothetical protein